MVWLSFLQCTSLCISCDKNLEEFLMLCSMLWASCFSFLSIKIYVCTWLYLLFVNNMCLVVLSFVFRTRLSNIRFWYRVSISLTHSSPFSKLFFICLLMTWQFTSKSNYCYKFRVTIRFFLLHNPSSSKFVNYSIVFTTSTI
jgi:hypothetical protein